MLTGLATPKRKNQYFFILKQTFPQGFDPLPSGTTDDRVQYHLNLKEGTSLLFPLLFTLVSITALQPLLPPSDLWQLQKRGLEKKSNPHFWKGQRLFIHLLQGSIRHRPLREKTKGRLSVRAAAHAHSTVRVQAFTPMNDDSLCVRVCVCFSKG